MTTPQPDTVWTRAVRGRRGPERSLDLDQLAAAGVELADVGGLDAVTMRAVAAQVGASSPGLYRYVETRDELIDLMVDHVTQELRLPRRKTPWRRQLLRLAIAQRDVYQQHPWLADATRGPRVLGPHGTRLVETYLQILEPVAVTTAVKLELLALLTGLAALLAPPTAIAANPFPLAGPTSAPLLWAAMTSPTGEPRSPESLFETVASGIVDALLG
ncbi:MAG: TetR/AcrR family transcriptional regulator [Intrasporangium sp.]|uniref:TetR/AcrR family transcriptional regulator n=1 Tax=Intrasporangium sp. TaxID=1925024 RepID=UPI0026470C56|nr:TetR/AcrR family transcriptional regulator [Intrasporangium sp.]MDN5798311.1 TetR/AcrR family transcriptional regulator [Intrasporangium sp.]